MCTRVVLLILSNKRLISSHYSRARLYQPRTLCSSGLCALACLLNVLGARERLPPYNVTVLCTSLDSLLSPWLPGLLSVML
jgi:hypothetical protein